MAKVIRREGESIDSLIKRFTAQCGHDGIIREYKAREEYVKPSDKKKLVKKQKQITIARYKQWKKRQDMRWEKFEKQISRRDPNRVANNTTPAKEIVDNKTQE